MDKLTPTREEMLDFAKMATFHLDDRLCPFSREDLRAESWLNGYYFAKRHQKPAEEEEQNRALMPADVEHLGKPVPEEEQQGLDGFQQHVDHIINPEKREAIGFCNVCDGLLFQARKVLQMDEQQEQAYEKGYDEASRKLIAKAESIISEAPEGLLSEDYMLGMKELLEKIKED